MWGMRLVAMLASVGGIVQRKAGLDSGRMTPPSRIRRGKKTHVMQQLGSTRSLRSLRCGPQRRCRWEHWPGSWLRWSQTSSTGPAPLIRTLLALLTVGLIWQFVLVVVLVYRERGSLRWSVLKEALWLHSPRSPKTGRVGGWLWLVVIPFVVLFAAEGAIPVLSVIPPVASHDFNVFLGSDAGQAFMSGNWVWFAVIVALFVFNTALGEELLFRGLLLPRMQGAFGRFDWVANGFLFALYHLHEPWLIPSSLVDIFALSYPSRRYRSALIGIIVHSSQSVFFFVPLLFLVLQ
jgi:membrane protease YdiL (CAAX protease family)